jgi:Tfp pilus assembly protein PilO
MKNESSDRIKNKYFPNLLYLTSERSQKFLGLILTLCALSFFGFFAIRPTISIILKLRKEIVDSEFVLSQLETKTKNLNNLRKQYQSLQNDLSVITDAITIHPEAQLLFAQIQSIAQTSGVAINKLQNFEVEVVEGDKNNNKNYYSYSFSVAGTGSFERISKFISTLTGMQRVVNIDMLSINNISSQIGESLGFDIQGTAFFKSDL